jgi:hypothetical protein
MVPLENRDEFLLTFRSSLVLKTQWKRLEVKQWPMESSDRYRFSRPFRDSKRADGREPRTDVLGYFLSSLRD